MVGQLTSHRAAAWAGAVGYTAVQHSLNVFFNAPSLMTEIESQGLWSVNRSPLAMGILSGKDYANQDFSKDIRANSLEWLEYFSRMEKSLRLSKSGWTLSGICSRVMAAH